MYVFKETESFLEYKPNTNLFTYRKDRPFRFLQKVAIWLLRKIGAFHIEQVSNVETIDINTDTLDQYIREQRRRYQKNTEGSTDGILLLGPENWEELSQDQSYYTHVDIGQTYDSERQYKGLRIIVLPWIKEPAFIPQDYLR